MYDDEVKTQLVGEKIIYSIDFTNVLSLNETLSSLTSVVAAGLTISDTSMSVTTNSVIFSVRGMECGNYNIVCTVETSTGEILTPKVKLRVR